MSQTNREPFAEIEEKGDECRVQQMEEKHELGASAMKQRLFGKAAEKFWRFSF